MSSQTIETNNCHPVDQHVGAKLRIRRLDLGLSQNELGNKLGITFQQVQKYEKGTNRIGASRLFEIANILNVEVQYFYSGLNGPGDAHYENDHDSDQLLSMVATQDGIQLCHSYFGIKNPTVKRRLLELVKSIADSH